MELIIVDDPVVLRDPAEERRQRQRLMEWYWGLAPFLGRRELIRACDRYDIGGCE